MGTVFLALILALIVWLIAISRENPTLTETFPQAVEINVRGLAPDLALVRNLDGESIRPVLQGPRSAWENLEADDITPYIDLTGLDVGDHIVDVEIEVLDPKVTLVESEQPELRITLDTILTQTLPIKVSILDSAAAGYEWQRPTIEPISATVRGPAIYVEDVSYLEATIFLFNAKQQVDQIRDIQAHRQNQESVNGIVIDPPSVRIIVPVGPRPGRKDVAIRPTLTGSPDAGYRLSAVKVEPSTIVLSGDNDQLSLVPGFVETEAITLTGATEVVQRWVSVVLPEDVSSSLGTGRVLVTASITPLEGGATVKRRPILESVEDNVEVRVSLDTVDVILRGPLPGLEQLTEDDVQVILNLSGLYPGIHSVTPTVRLPDGITWEGLLPETVEVVIVSSDANNPSNTILPPTPTPQTESPLTRPVQGD
ncbi:MAG: CdaR family protein [Chloroflexota bacterium]